MNLEPKPFTKIYCGKELLKALDAALQNTSINKEEQMKEETKKPLFKEGQFVRIKREKENLQIIDTPLLVV